MVQMILLNRTLKTAIVLCMPKKGKENMSVDRETEKASESRKPGAPGQLGWWRVRLLISGS